MWRLLILYNLLAKFGGYKPSGSGDIIIYLTCHVTWQDYVIKGTNYFIDESFSLYVNTLQSVLEVSPVIIVIYINTVYT